MLLVFMMLAQGLVDESEIDQDGDVIMVDASESESKFGVGFDLNQVAA